MKIKEFQTSGKRGVIFLGNEASLSGAPMVLLSLIQTFKGDGYECFVILLKGGQLLERYNEVATVLLCDYSTDPVLPVQTFLDAISPSIENGQIAKVAVANTVSVLKLQAVLKQHGFKVLSLVHELADYYPDSYFNKLYNASNHVIFSSEFSLQSALKRSTRPEALKLEVKTQGLLPNAGEPADIALSRKQIRAELGVSKDAFIVLSCGSITLRKGIDYFIQTARAFQRSTLLIDTTSAEHSATRTAERESVFVWIGDNPIDDEAPLYFASWDIKQMGLKNIRLLKPRQDLATWFAGADVFLLPSKQDPMPCVAHSALAAGIPVIAFKDASGTQELLQEGGGTLVDYGDVSAMADAVLNYLLNEDERKKAGLEGQYIAAQKLKFSEYYQHIKQIVEKPSLVESAAEGTSAAGGAQPITLDQKIEFLKSRLRARLSSKSWVSTQGLRLFKKFLTPASKNAGLNPDKRSALTLSCNNTLPGDNNGVDIETTCADKDAYFAHLSKMLQSIRTSLSWRLSRPIRVRQVSMAPDKTAAVRAILAPTKPH